MTKPTTDTSESFPLELAKGEAREQHAAHLRGDNAGPHSDGAQAPENEPQIQYCDLIMKGGITSGVVYPQLISGLAEKYHFKNIGGASAGAIAAAACAAAEFGRQNGNPAAFTELASLPKTLGEKVTAEGRTRLFTLFQPGKHLRRHFSVLVSALNSSREAGGMRILEGLVRMYATIGLVAMLIGIALLWPIVCFATPEASSTTVLILSAACMAVAAFVASKVLRDLI